MLCSSPPLFVVLGGPKEAGEVDAVVGFEYHAFSLEEIALSLGGFGGGEGDFAVAVDDAVPGEVFGLGEGVKDAGDLAGAAWLAGEGGDPAVGGDPAGGDGADQLDDLMGEGAAFHGDGVVISEGLDSMVPDLAMAFKGTGFPSLRLHANEEAGVGEQGRGQGDRDGFDSIRADRSLDLERAGVLHP